MPAIRVARILLFMRFFRCELRFGRVSYFRERKRQARFTLIAYNATMRLMMSLWVQMSGEDKKQHWHAYLSMWKLSATRASEPTAYPGRSRLAEIYEKIGAIPTDDELDEEEEDVNDEEENNAS